MPAFRQAALHVVPGSGGGNGSSAIHSEASPPVRHVAQPGDVSHPRWKLWRTHTSTKPGNLAGRHRVEAVAMARPFAASTSRPVTYGGGLTLRSAFRADVENAPTGVVISRCRFSTSLLHHLQRGGSYWYIADNTIVGDTRIRPRASMAKASSLNGTGRGFGLRPTAGDTAATDSADRPANPRADPLRACTASAGRTWNLPAILRDHADRTSCARVSLRDLRRRRGVSWRNRPSRIAPPHRRRPRAIQGIHSFGRTSSTARVRPIRRTGPTNAGSCGTASCSGTNLRMHGRPMASSSSKRGVNVWPIQVMRPGPAIGGAAASSRNTRRRA